jgi:hypothetical protein
LVALWSLVAWLLSSMAVPAVARADEAFPFTREFGSWRATLEALQDDVQSEGRVVHILVNRRDGLRYACGYYVLRLQGQGLEGLSLGPCDDDTGATELRVVRRTELFDHERALPTRREIRLEAEGWSGRLVECSAEVRPSMRDIEHGTLVRFAPDRYQLNSNAPAQVEARGDHWVIRAPGTAERPPEVNFTVHDPQRHETVMAGATLRLACPVVPPDPPRATLRSIDRRNAAFESDLRWSQIGATTTLVGGAAAAAGAVGALFVGAQVGHHPEALLWTLGIGGAVTGLGLILMTAGGVMCIVHPSPHGRRARTLSFGVGPTDVDLGVATTLTARF